VRSVNRQLYFLADGNKDPGLYVDACEACRGYEDCSCDEFASTVGLLKDDSKRLKALGFKKKDFDDNGCFGTNKLPKLMAFCVGHPEYHIVTQGYGGYCNRARTDDEADDDDPVGYYLADGSKDPKLCSHRYACSCADFQG